jgi:hypothetical protein
MNEDGNWKIIKIHNAASWREPGRQDQVYTMKFSSTNGVVQRELLDMKQSEKYAEYKNKPS